MAEFSDLFPVTNIGNTNNQTIVVTNGQNNTVGPCLPCNDDASCAIAPSRVASVDNSKFLMTGDQRLRMAVVTGASGGNITLFPDADTTSDAQFLKEFIYPELYDLLFDQIGGAHGGLGGTINGVQGNIWLSGLMSTLRGGFVISRIIVRGASADVDAVVITVCQLPLNPANSTVCHTELTPFCDFCTTTNVGDTTTHAYTGNFAGSWWNYVNIALPGSATLTIELCFGAVNVPNTQISTVADAGGF